MIFGLNEVGPTNVPTIIIVSLMMLFSSILNANIFGEIAVLL